MDISKTTGTIKFDIILEDDKKPYFVSVIASITNIPDGINKDFTVFYDNVEVDVVQ
jgi:hypothetical protein